MVGMHRVLQGSYILVIHWVTLFSERLSYAYCCLVLFFNEHEGLFKKFMELDHIFSFSIKQAVINLSRSEIYIKTVRICQLLNYVLICLLLLPWVWPEILINTTDLKAYYLSFLRCFWWTAFVISQAFHPGYWRNETWQFLLCKKESHLWRCLSWTDLKSVINRDVYQWK